MRWLESDQPLDVVALLVLQLFDEFILHADDPIFHTVGDLLDPGFAILYCWFARIRFELAGNRSEWFWNVSGRNSAGSLIFAALAFSSAIAISTLTMHSKKKHFRSFGSGNKLSKRGIPILFGWHRSPNAPFSARATPAASNRRSYHEP